MLLLQELADAHYTGLTHRHSAHTSPGLRLYAATPHPPTTKGGVCPAPCMHAFGYALPPVLDMPCLPTRAAPHLVLAAPLYPIPTLLCYTHCTHTLPCPWLLPPAPSTPCPLCLPACIFNTTHCWFMYIVWHSGSGLKTLHTLYHYVHTPPCHFASTHFSLAHTLLYFVAHGLVLCR